MDRRMAAESKNSACKSVQMHFFHFARFSLKVAKNNYPHSLELICIIIFAQNIHGDNSKRWMLAAAVYGGFVIAGAGLQTSQLSHIGTYALFTSLLQL